MSTTRVNISAYKSRFNGRMADFKRGVMLKLFGSVVYDTPVLKGRLRGNWTFTIGTPSDAQTDFVGDPMPVITEGVETLVQTTDAEYFLTNNMEYANMVEYEGHSSVKAPEGMVRKNLIRIASILIEQKGVNV